jgi:hypothetical protein
MFALYKQFSQGLYVTACSLVSFSTLGYMINDIHKLEKKQIKSTYEKQITVLNEEIMNLKQNKLNLNH